MKKLISLKFILSSATLACVLIGSLSAQNSNAQTQPVPSPNTDLISTSANNDPTTDALPPDIDPNGALAQVIRLLQAGVEQSVILTYISNSASPFNLSADDIIYLNDLGAPPEIANAMMERDQQLQQMGVPAEAQSTPPAETTETAATQPAEVTVNYFYDTLAPYGAWVDIEGYGWCWRPTIVIYDAGWQPYCNNGHWVYTDCGWYWVSGYSWGWAAFHYGRWFHNPRYGWCWWPDTTWAPSWVCWRYNQNYCGWAPLPPRAVYRPGVGFFYNGHAVSAGFTFGLSVGAFTFVATRDFCDLQPWRHRIGERETAHIYDHTEFSHGFDFNRHDGMIVNSGIPPHNITAVTRREIHPVTLRAENRNVTWSGRHEQFEQAGRTLVVNRPHFVGSPVLSVHPEARPTVEHRQYEFHPTTRGNENNVSPHQEVNQNSHANFNRTPPRVPQTRQSEVPRAATPESQGYHNVITAPHSNNPTWPAQNQAPRYNYNYNNRVLSPRARGLEQQSPRGAFHGPVQGNEQHFSAPPANHYSPPVQHFAPQRHVEEPQSSHSSSSSGHSNQQGQGNGQGGH